MLTTSIHKLFSEAAAEFSEPAKKWMPEWLTKHKALKSYEKDRIFKIFSVYGLKDFRQNVDDPSVIENFKDFLASAFSRVVKDLMRAPDSPETNQLEQVAYKLTQEVMKPNLWALDKHKIPIQIFSDDKKFRIDAGTSIIKAYNLVKSKAAALGISIPNIESTREFKDYSKRGKMTVVFSTNQDDIAAMSSRSRWVSCQTIETTQGLGACIVGSVMSKFVGVCYVTSGSPFLDRGEEMVARCLVRFAIDTTNKKPVFFLDKMYPGHSAVFAKMMIESIQSRANVPVIDSEKLSLVEDRNKYRVPKEKIKELREEEQSYQDNPEFFRDPDEKPQKDPHVKIRNLQVYFKETIAGLTSGLAVKTSKYFVSNYMDLYSRYANAENKEFLKLESIRLCRRVAIKLTEEIGLKLAEHYKKNKEPFSKNVIDGLVAKSILSERNKGAILEGMNMYIDEFGRRAIPDPLAKLLMSNENVKTSLSDYIYDQLMNIIDYQHPYFE